MTDSSDGQAESRNEQAESNPVSDVQFRVHARALAALGRDLVTNDAVAVMELVKNSYDALATRVVVRIRPPDDSDNSAEAYIEVDDNGHGMDLNSIRDAWCVVATPTRAERPVAKSGRRSRMVTGEKGLGRLAAARLGDELRVRTKKAGGPILEFSLQWNGLFGFTDVSDAGIAVSELAENAFAGESGTSIRVGSLRSDWDDDKTDDLRANLARLLSPFGVEDFEIRMEASGHDGESDIRRIQLPEFLADPKYYIAGNVDEDGTIRWNYRYRPIGGIDGRDDARNEKFSRVDGSEPNCGPFEFEIRAWDLSLEDTRDIAEHYEETRNRIRGLIREHRGISVYRDEVLVLPKSERARDWLGLDLRRVSRVGGRLSTSQILGNVRITKAGNPNVVDTSDRERLVDNAAFEDFRAILLRVMEILENERDSDRDESLNRESAKDLFANVTAEPLISQLEALHEEGANVEDAIPVTRTFALELDRARTDIEGRFGYYNRLAVVGTIAQVVIHEIRNRVTVIGRGLRKADAAASASGDRAFGRAVKLAMDSAASLNSLADRFAPLARRGYRLGRRNSILEEAIWRCCEMLAPEIDSLGIAIEANSRSRTAVRIDPGELDAVIINLITNSLYWMGRRECERRLRFRITRGLFRGRVTVSIDDTGPGIDPLDRDLIFRPGWTRKPSGIGMGLVVASEMVEDRGGKMRTLVPGELGGATFEFDLPLVADGSNGDSS